MLFIFGKGDRMKENLRPCIVNIPEVTEKYRTAENSVIQTRVVNEAETHKGYFHTWAHESYVTNGFIVGTTAGQVSSLRGIVEYEDGTVHKVEPECITFTDDIDYNMIPDAGVKMIKD